MSQIDNKSPIDGVICTIVSGAPRSRVWRGRLFEGIEMPQTMKSSAHPSAQAGRRLSRAVPVFTRWADMALPAAIGRYPRIASSTASCSTTKSCQVRSGASVDRPRLKMASRAPFTARVSRTLPTEVRICSWNLRYGLHEALPVILTPGCLHGTEQCLQGLDQAFGGCRAIRRAAGTSRASRSWKSRPGRPRRP